MTDDREARIRAARARAKPLIECENDDCQDCCFIHEENLAALLRDLLTEAETVGRFVPCPECKGGGGHLRDSENFECSTCSVPGSDTFGTGRIRRELAALWEICRFLREDNLDAKWADYLWKVYHEKWGER